MESLPTLLRNAPPLHNHTKAHKPSPSPLLPKPISLPSSSSSSSVTLIATITSASSALYSLPCLAEADNKISIEAVVVSIDDFFRRYPFFVAGCTFIWLIALPVAKYYLSKCKYIYPIDAFKRLQEDPDAQLLDIREPKMVQSLRSPSLRLFGKTTVQVHYSEAVPDDGFLKSVLANFPDPANTVVCILDDLDGNSMKVAELLFKNGFKEAYALKGGVAGKKGWLEIQEKLLPPAVHILYKKKTKKIKEPGEKAGVDSAGVKETRGVSARSSSPYPNYPDLKSPTSPMPSKPSSK